MLECILWTRYPDRSASSQLDLPFRPNQPGSLSVRHFLRYVLGLHLIEQASVLAMETFNGSRLNGSRVSRFVQDSSEFGHIFGSDRMRLATRVGTRMTTLCTACGK